LIYHGYILTSSDHETGFPPAFIVGTVLDNTNQQPLANVSVTLKNPAKTVFTNALGKYQFENLAAGTYAVAISHVGYTQQTIAVTVQEDQATGIITRLLAAAVELGELPLQRSKHSTSS
jgi:hypothetical protein